jgi:hypothetical protein
VILHGLGELAPIDSDVLWLLQLPAVGLRILEGENN